MKLAIWATSIVFVMLVILLISTIVNPATTYGPLKALVAIFVALLFIATIEIVR